MKIEIKHRLSGEVLFAREFSDAGDASALGLKIGVAVRAAIQAGAPLAWADLTGADLAWADLTGADLTGADLTGAHLTGARLTRANMAVADLTDADLTDANLTGARLTRANMAAAHLSGADLTGADLTGIGVPIVPNIDEAILRAIERGGELDMDAWHTCETTHCRAGWAITLAGAAGAALESRVGPAAAGALIYAVSRSKPVPDFYAPNADALADLRACAAQDPSVSEAKREEPR